MTKLQRVQRLRKILGKAQQLSMVLMTDLGEEEVQAQRQRLGHCVLSGTKPQVLRKRITTRIRMLRELLDKMYVINSKEVK